MSNDKHEIIEAAIAEGSKGGSLGAILTGKSKDALASVIAGTAIDISIKAAEEAKNTNIPVLYELDGAIYSVYPDGHSEFIKNIDKVHLQVPSTFNIE